MNEEINEEDLHVQAHQPGRRKKSNNMIISLCMPRFKLSILEA